MIILSDEFLALQDADVLLRDHRSALYVGSGAWIRLPTDATTQAAFSALCGACRYIERLTQEHVTGKRESNGAE